MSYSEKPIRRSLLHALAATEEAVDAGRRALAKKFNYNLPAYIAAYGGWSDAAGTHLTGRVLAKHPGGGPLDDNTLWDNFVSTLHHLNSAEVPGAEVTLRFQGKETTVTCDDEGYYQFSFPPAMPDAGMWTSAEATVRGKDQEITASHPVVCAPAASFGIISDLDDTVIHTGITSILLTAKLTFLGNARTRKPLEGVAALYSALQNGGTAAPVNPIFYVSSSPWNLHDLLWDFIELNGIPQGPILLRDFGIDRTKFIAEKGHGHKQDKALSIIDGYPHLPFVLIGDSGQEDATLYAEICERRPGRVTAIYIRDVEPGQHTARDTAVHRAVDLAAAHGVPMIIAPDSRAMAEHAARIGLIPESDIFGISSEIEADLHRPAAGEQALRDTADSILP